MTFAAFRPRRDGTPWHSIHDAALIEDWLWGCSLFTMSQRALRSEEECLARLVELGYSLESQPKPRRIRSITWTRRD